MKKKILVTGGSGYKGVKLISKLVEEGYQVINLDINYFGNYFIKNKSVKNYNLNILEIKKLNLKNVYACIHLACIANDPMVDLNPSLSWETSALGTKLLMDHLVKNKHKVTVLDNFSTGRKSNLSHVKKKIKIINIDISIAKNLDKYLQGKEIKRKIYIPNKLMNIII